MKINEEKGGAVFVSDMPPFNDYSNLLHRAKDIWPLIKTDYPAFDTKWQELLHDTESLLANCIARGIRLAKEGKYQ